MSNEDWANPHDPEAEITRLKDGRTALAYKAENAVDMETGAIVAVTTHGGRGRHRVHRRDVAGAAEAVAEQIAETTSEGKYAVNFAGVEGCPRFCHFVPAFDAQRALSDRVRTLWRCWPAIASATMLSIKKFARLKTANLDSGC